jgi:hypothetical protein
MIYKWIHVAVWTNYGLAQDYLYNRVWKYGTSSTTWILLYLMYSRKRTVGRWYIGQHGNCPAMNTMKVQEVKQKEFRSEMHRNVDSKKVLEVTDYESRNECIQYVSIFADSFTRGIDHIHCYTYTTYSDIFCERRLFFMWPLVILNQVNSLVTHVLFVAHGRNGADGIYSDADRECSEFRNGQSRVQSIVFGTTQICLIFYLACNALFFSTWETNSM